MYGFSGRVYIFAFSIFMKDHSLYLLLGSNLGDRRALIEQAVAYLGEKIGLLRDRSSFYETEPWGFESEKYFLNIAVRIDTVLSPERVMQMIDEIEKEMGRERRGKGYSSRTIDIDILFFDDLIIENADLKIPHPKITERRFVLIPMNEIAPALRHPAVGKTISELLQSCADDKKVERKQ
jgi:2-amino-4-hydroxy-6-hydroxymethyldihydropteridine diphosphokinase